MTIQEFLEWPGDDRAKRYQLIDGEVRPILPTEVAFGAIHVTLGSMIIDHLDRLGSAWLVLAFPSINPPLHAGSNLRVADIGVISTPIRLDQIIVDDLLLLIEIVSRSNPTKAWTNAWAYSTIPSVKEIVVVQSARVEIQVLRPSAEGIWPLTPDTIVAGDRLKLHSLGLDCAIEDVYSALPFSMPSSRRATAD